MAIHSWAFLLTATSLVLGGWAGKHGEILVETHPPPEIIEESPRSISCPPDFKLLGKQCAKRVFTEPEFFCPPGTIRTDETKGDRCARFFPKIQECPAAYERIDGICVKTVKTEPIVVCPQGFVLTPDGLKCVRSVPLPPIEFCPPGTIRRGDVCTQKQPVPAQLVCPQNFRLEGHRCVFIETFDCTPPRLLPIPPPPLIPVKDGKKHLRMLAEGEPLPAQRELGHKHSSFIPPPPPPGPILPPVSKKEPSLVEEYVVQKECRRIRSEGARRICPEHAVLEGKECFIEIREPLLTKPGGFVDEFAPAGQECPAGFFPSPQYGKLFCIMKENAPPKDFCPPNTVDLGYKCAIFLPELLRCPPEFILEGEKCIKTIFLPPEIEYTVTFACVGKNCADKTLLPPPAPLPPPPPYISHKGHKH